MTRRLLVVGAGLIGTSVALATSAAGFDVFLSDVDPDRVRAAAALGAGRPWRARGAVVDVDHAVLCVPPRAVVDAARHVNSFADTISDCAGVKANVVAQVETEVSLAGKFVGGHPMAGRQHAGPWRARPDLFRGRPWILTPTPTTSDSAVAAARGVAAACGAQVVLRSPGEHDRAVATVSQLPQLFATVLAARLGPAAPADLELTGQGLRDMTRIADSPPQLWGELMAANAAQLTSVLDAAIADLTAVRDALAAACAAPADGYLRAAARDLVAELVRRGNRGRGRLPGVHGGPAAASVRVLVAVPDRPGELARLLDAVAAIGVNVEDITLDHAPGRPLGVVELLVAPGAADRVMAHLRDAGWGATLDEKSDR